MFRRLFRRSFFMERLYLGCKSESILFLGLKFALAAAQQRRRDSVAAGCRANFRAVIARARWWSLSRCDKLCPRSGHFGA
jgi:hypothetical protein